MKKSTVKEKFLMTHAYILSTLLASPVFAETPGAGENPIGKGAKAAEELTKTITTASVALFILAVVLAGIFFALGDEMKRKGMNWLMNVFMAIALVAGAASIVGFLWTLFGGQ